MSFSFGFYNSLNHDRLYDAIQVSEIFDGIITDGVYSAIGDHLVVKASENENMVIVGSGRAWFDHTWNKNDADLPIQAPLPDLLMQRYDALVIDINSNVAERTNSIMWVEGIPSLNNPVKPTLIDTVDHHQHPLCYVLRTASNNTIIQDDIENTIGTDECPFVTGILQQVSISDLLLQWTAQFATFMNTNEATATAWENEWEASMSLWTIEQKNEFATWMAGEKTEFDDWFANLHYILDGDVAGHLQNEIDAIEEGLGGSVFTIHTINSSLYGKTVTCTGSTQEKTAVFDASGNAEIKGITDIGNITFTATDGTQTATTVQSVPYFSNYPITMAFWAATVNISTTTEDLKGKTITVRKGGAVVGSTSFNAAGAATYTATSAGTYTFSCQGYSVELVVTEETTYSIVINSGLELSTWITAGSTTDYPLNPSSYANFAALEADEEAVRQLMTVHAAVDYLYTASADDALIDDIINSDICAKWINLRDYALDKLSSNVNIKSVMDEADKYGYGEWCLIPQVPKMTSNTAPYGEAYASTSATNNPAYYAFDNNDSTYWQTPSNTSGASVGYKFANPVNVKRYTFRGINPSATLNECRETTITLQYSDDGTNYTDVNTVTVSAADQLTTKVIEADNDVYALYWRIVYGTYNYQSNSGYYCLCASLQFLAYEPIGNVPIMTANNAPYGVASAISGDSNGYLAFAGSGGSWRGAAGQAGEHYLQYKFVNPVCVKKFTLINDSNYSSYASTKFTWLLKASNDGTNWTDLNASIELSVYDTVKSHEVIVNNDNYYLYYKLTTTGTIHTAGQYALNLSALQFYGRELIGNIIPKMTSNTTPKGVASTNSVTTGDAYNAFDGNDSTCWYKYNPGSTISGGVYVQYEFDTPVDLKGFGEIIGAPGTGSTVPFKVQALKNNTWETLYTGSFPANSNPTKYKFIFTPMTNVDAIRYLVDNPPKNGNNYIYGTVFRLAFLDLDYSEKEFAPGSTRKTIYDHGVELETVLTATRGTASIVKESNQIYGYKGNAANSGFEFGAKLNISDYDYFYVKAGNKWYRYPYLSVDTDIDAYNTGQIAYAHIASTASPYTLLNIYGQCDISSCNSTYAVALYYAETNNSGEYWGTVKEMWLE